jgi:cytochrome d ubiquinol oxidase subunit I
VLGDESGYEMGDVQKTKLAAIEAEWETQPLRLPLPCLVFRTRMHKQTISHPDPYAGYHCHSFRGHAGYWSERPAGQHEARIRNGMKAYTLLEELRAGSTDQAVRDEFNSVKKDLGYGLLLKRYTPNVSDATEAQIAMATKDSIPRVAPLYFAFRIMVACGILMLGIIAASFWTVIRNQIGEKKWLLRIALYAIPLPWIAIESGWFVAEYGRQPWAIGEVLPTAVANSSLTAGDLIFSMLLICGLYTLFLVAELYLMFKFARRGPSSLKTGRYHYEQSSTTTQPAR